MYSEQQQQLLRKNFLTIDEKYSISINVQIYTVVAEYVVNRKILNPRLTNKLTPTVL